MENNAIDLLDVVIKYGGIVWGIVASVLLAKQQMTLLQQKNQLAEFAVDALEKYNELENAFDSRMDASEEEHLLQLERLQARLDVHDNEISSAQGWIRKAYNYILFEETSLPIIREEDNVGETET